MDSDDDVQVFEGGDTEAETTELKVLELPLTAEASNTLNDEHEAPSTELDVSKADNSKVWASEVDEASSEAFGEHEPPSFSPKAGDIDEVQVDISGFYDTDHESLESKQTLDESEESEADPAGNSRGAEIGRRPRADAPQEEEPAVGDMRSGRRPRARSNSESRKSSDSNSKGNSKDNSVSDPEFTVEDMQKNRERIASTLTPLFHKPNFEYNSNARNTRNVYGAGPQAPGEFSYYGNSDEDVYARQCVLNTFGRQLPIAQTPIKQQIGVGAGHSGFPHGFVNTCTKFQDSGPEALSLYSGDVPNTQSNAPNQQEWKSTISTEKEDLPEESVPEQGKVVLLGDVILNPKTPEGPSSKTAENGKCGERPTLMEYERQQQEPTVEKTEVQGKCSENLNPLETPIEPTNAENMISGKCGENPIIFQKTSETTTEPITAITITQENVIPTPLVENQAMLAVRQQKERAQVQAELDRQIAYASEYQTEANNDQIIEVMDCQTAPSITVEAQIHQEQSQIEKEKQAKPPPKPVVRGLPGPDIPLSEPWKEFSSLFKEADKKALERNQALIEKRALEAKLKHERKLTRRKSVEDEPNIERKIINIKNKKGTKILQIEPTTPAISDGGDNDRKES
ncbi:hypothetical protein JTB14_038345 [Gonioctena quinquepunctata]|nr:hypothetical protein JTB14_038345 [Gonioctena quinquepunctata]